MKCLGHSQAEPEALTEVRSSYFMWHNLSQSTRGNKYFPAPLEAPHWATGLT